MCEVFCAQTFHDPTLYFIFCYFDCTDLENMPKNKAAPLLG